MTHESTMIDWRRWLERWDAMQTGYIPDREARFATMLDVLDVVLPESFVAVDLASGPGAISRHLLERFPRARCIAVDYDPLLLALGQATLGEAGDRLRWVETDLRDPGWAERLGEVQVDAVLSSTALHWLDAGQLAALYHRLGQLVRPGGVVLNGDHLRFSAALPTFRRITDALRERQEAVAFERGGVETWRQWWEAIAGETALRDALAERTRRFAHRSDDESAPIVDLHEAALRDAGFREVGLIWRNVNEGVLLAVC